MIEKNKKERKLKHFYKFMKPLSKCNQSLDLLNIYIYKIVYLNNQVFITHMAIEYMKMAW